MYERKRGEAVCFCANLKSSLKVKLLLFFFISLKWELVSVRNGRAVQRSAVQYVCDLSVCFYFFIFLSRVFSSTD
jgi:hypothetical protein